MLKNRNDLIELRNACSASLKLQTRKILVCGGTGCVAGGSMDIHDKLVELIRDKGINCSIEIEKDPHEESIGIKKSGCHGFCEMGPLVRIEPEGILYTKVSIDDCEEIVEKTIVNREVIERLLYKVEGKPYIRQEDIPFYAKQHRVVLEHCGHIDATSVMEYLAIGGYEAFEKALFEVGKGSKTIYISSDDIKLKEKIEQIPDTSRITVEASGEKDFLGGTKVLNTDRKVAVDYSFKEMLSEEKQKFLQSSGLALG